MGMIDNEGFDYYFCEYASDVFGEYNDPNLAQLEKEYREARTKFHDAVQAKFEELGVDFW
jgi:hypothetical protein